MFVDIKPPQDFSNWKIYVTVKVSLPEWLLNDDFSNWKIYVTVKEDSSLMQAVGDFSNWKIYVTVKVVCASRSGLPILVTEKFTWL